MKKYILILLLTVVGYGQTLQNPTFGNTTTNTLKIKTPATVTSVDFLPAFDADGITISKIDPVNLPFTTIITAGKGLMSGDSTIAPYIGQTGVAALLVLNTDISLGNSITDISFPGDRIAQQKTAFLALTDKNTYDYIVVEIGLNDIDYATPDATIIARLQDYINTINANKKASCKVVIATMTPCKQRWIDLRGTVNGAIEQAQWVAINEAIKGNGATPITGVDMRAFEHTIALADPVGNLAPIYDMGDHIHENTAARDIIAQVHRKALNQWGFLKSSIAKSIMPYTENSNFYLQSTTTDAGNSKTVAIQRSGAVIVSSNTEPIVIAGNSTSNGIGVSASSDSGLALKVSTTTGTKIASFVVNAVEKSYILPTGGYVVPSFTASNSLLANGTSLANPNSGTGTTGNLPLFTGTTTFGNSSVQQIANGNLIVNGGAGADVVYLNKSTGASLGLSGSTGTTNPVILNATGTTNPEFQIYVGGALRQTITNTGTVGFPVLSGTGTRQVVADASGNLSATTVQPLKYVASLTQTGTSAPAATVLENTTGATVTWTRSATGFYTGTFTGAPLTAGKRVVLISPRTGGSVFYDFLTTSTVQVVTTTVAGAGTDGLLNETGIEIRIYP